MKWTKAIKSHKISDNIPGFSISDKTHLDFIEKLSKIAAAFDGKCGTHVPN